MFLKLLFSSIIILVSLDISIPLKTQAKHQNSLIYRFCIASLKSKIKFKDKKKSGEISRFTCDCFAKKFKSGSSIKSSRNYCKDKAAEKYTLQ